MWRHVTTCKSELPLSSEVEVWDLRISIGVYLRGVNVFPILISRFASWINTTSAVIRWGATKLSEIIVDIILWRTEVEYTSYTRSPKKEIENSKIQENSHLEELE